MDHSTFDDLYGSDEDRSSRGVPIHVGLNRKNEPIVLMVAEAGNPKHMKATRKYDKALESSRHSPKKRRLINAKIIAESLLTGWSGVIDTDGLMVEASFENKIDALTRSQKLMNDVIDAASDRINFSTNIELDEDGEDKEEDPGIDPVQETEGN